MYSERTCMYACEEIRAKLHILHTVLRVSIHVKKVIQNPKQDEELTVGLNAFKRHIRNHCALLHQVIFEPSVALSHTIFNAGFLCAIGTAVLA